MTDHVTTRVSESGMITLPEAVLERQHLDAGTDLLVEETPEGMLLKKRPIFPPTLRGLAFGILKYEGRPKTIEEVNEGVPEEARRNFLRSVDPD